MIRLPPVLRILTPLGWSVLATVFVAGIVALVFGWVEAAAIALLAALALIAGIPFIIGRPQYRISARLTPPRVVVGHSVTAEVAVQNSGSHATADTTFEMPIGPEHAAFGLPRLGAGERHEQSFPILARRRAILAIGPVRSVRSDPLGLWRRETSWTHPTELYVHPRTVRLEGDTAGLLRDLEGMPTRDLASDDVSFHALREYVAGDDLRQVHWRSTARAQTLMIRQFEQTRRSHLVLALSTSRADYVDDDEFELAVSIAASLGIHALRGGRDVTSVTTDAALPAPTATQLLDRLSGVESSSNPSGVESLARIVARAVPGASVVALVTGSRVPASRLRDAATRIPPTAHVLALRSAPEEPFSRRRIGDLAVSSVPGLDALRAVAG
jgi:uncharacterized protein (DUF58 family)